MIIKKLHTANNTNLSRIKQGFDFISHMSRHHVVSKLKSNEAHTSFGSVIRPRSMKYTNYPNDVLHTSQPNSAKKYEDLHAV